MDETAELRHRIKHCGYSPIPCDGKRPPMPGWDQKFNASEEEIALWSQLYHLAKNTGIFTRLTPTVDIDILNGEAADAVEALARDRFEERGQITVRFGNAPKRAILLRTDVLFKKITANVISPAGIEEKIELLAEGQQVVVFGIHPQTGKPYSWHGGDPQTTPWEDLPYVNEADARAFMVDAANLLVAQYGYSTPEPRPRDKGNGAGQPYAADWGWLVQNIVASRDLHAATLSLTQKLVLSGMSDGAVVNFVHGLMELSSGPKDARWHDRYNDIRRLVSTARHGTAAATETIQRLIHSSAEFVRGFVPPDYLLDGILQRRFCYCLTGRTGSGKTAVALLLAALVAMGAPLGKRDVAQGRVLYFAGENPDDIRMRWIAMAPHFGFDVDEICVNFVPNVVEISAILDRICEEARLYGDLSLVVVDTSAAYYEGDDENSNTQQLAHAKRLRALSVLMPGGPTILTLCHPTKNAAPDNLIPRGGGGFVAEMDGNLTCSKDGAGVELHWQGKFRGPDFDPIALQLKTVNNEQLKDTKGRTIPTVIASYLSPEAQEDMAKAARSKENLLLAEIGRTGQMSSLAEMGKALGWYYHSGEPDKSAVRRALHVLKQSHLVAEERGITTVTDKGQKALKKQTAKNDETDDED